VKRINFFVFLFFYLSVSVISNHVEAEGIQKTTKNEKPLANGKSISSGLIWPLVNHRETRPWTWWWWHGCAVNKADITSSLEAMQRSGLGGVNIVCLLDVKDEGVVKLSYLSKEWMEMLAFAVHEAHRLGMDADVSPVSGWAFGGPQVSINDACSIVDVQRISLSDCKKNNMRIATFDANVPDAPKRFDLSGVIAKSDNGKVIELTDKVDKNGILNWTAPEGNWTLFCAINHPGSSQVRMPTPDGKGWVVDHLSAKAVSSYLQTFSKTFALADPQDLPRAFNNDSWEIRLNWTRDFPTQFAKRRGYNLIQNLPALIGEGKNDTISRIIYDYRLTINDLMLNEFTHTFNSWAASLGRKTIGEACNEPANELDVHARYDIPQADVGGPARWYLKNGNINLFRAKVASSPAHILGKPYVSSETLTCYGPILDTPLADAKDKIDIDMLSGINHTMLHGITYSPANAPWPGWLFYAGFHLGPFNPMWRQGSKMCNYITHCQSFLQSGKPCEDLLVYFPIHDYWSQRPKDRNGVLNHEVPMGVRMQEANAPTGPELWHMGFDFAWVSDLLLNSIRVEDGCFVSPGATYRALVIADCHLFPDTTLDHVIKYAEAGGTIIFPGAVPSDAPGFTRLEERRNHFRSLMQRIENAAKPVADGIREARIGKGRIFIGGTADQVLTIAGIKREKLFDSGLRCIRRIDNEGTTYFVVNPANNKPFDGWLPLNARGANVAIFDPMDSISGIAKQRKSEAGDIEVYMQLQPRESRILRVLKKPVNSAAWRYFDTMNQPLSIQGPWQVKFIDGGEIIPHPETIDKLDSWTIWNSDQKSALRGFSGTACYTTHFIKPSIKADDWIIDLGTVWHTARIRLNGILLADRFTTPMQAFAGQALKEGDNLLEIEVSNAPINRAADLEIKGVQWQKCLSEDNKKFVIGDFLFPWKKKEAATWEPRPSGLMGPVKLIPMKMK
jgi:hypothetical protein